MTLWEFLKPRMEHLGERIAFSNGNISYLQLVRLVEREKGDGSLCIVNGDTKQEMAINLLRCLARGDVAIPIDMGYGKTYIHNLQDSIGSDENKYPDVAFIIFTSGTTGMPKGVMLSHEAVIENLKGIDDYFKVSIGQRLLIVRSLVHISALTGELLFGLYKGLRIDFFEEQFVPRRLGTYMQKCGTEIFCCTPTILYRLYRYLDQTVLTDIVISGERISTELVGLLRKYRNKIRFYNVYGLTENAPRVSALIPEEFFDHIGSVGTPILNTEIKVENEELLVRSKSMMSGYYKRADETEKKLRNGWLHTGDIAKIENDFITICGRKDSMLIRGGLNIFPEDIEREVQRIDGVVDCIAYGKDDTAFGQKIYLDYVGEINEIEVRKILAKRLPATIMPNCIRKTDSIPMTVSGKKKRQ